METPLTLLYTHNLRGRLDLLPRLHTFIRRLRGEFAEGDTYLIDLGASCDPDVWPCAITEGRSTLIVLDAMGYHVANTQAVLTPPSRAKLIDQVALALVDNDHPHSVDNITFASSGTHNDDTFHIHLIPSDAAVLTENALMLTGLQAGQIGIARVTSEHTLRHEIHTMPVDTPPEPTISGAVQFVRDEARYFEKRRDEGL